MKFLHLADLHFGKMIHGVSMLENGDQAFWVDRFLEVVQEKKPDAIVIAGDVYDRAFPSGEAVQLLSRFLTTLADMGIPVLVTAGNHDSVQRLSFANSILAKQNLYISGPLSGLPELTHVTLHDKYGPVTFWLMPYVFPALVSQCFDGESIHDYDEAVRQLLAAQEIDFTKRNVLIAHQNVTANGVEGIRGGSETMVGGVGQVDYTAFDGFDYVALGHIHASYAVGRETVRYAGSPLCYHFEETKQRAKGPLLVTINEKQSAPQIETCPILPLHPMREAKGTYEDLRLAELQPNAEHRNEYLRVVITDQFITPEISNLFHQAAEARGTVLMELASEYNRFQHDATAPELEAMQSRSVESLFADFYSERNGGETLDLHDLDFLTFVGEQVRHTDTHGKIDPQLIERLLDYLTKQEGEV